MVFYLARRLAWAVGVLVAVTAITFAIFYLLPPGDPALRFVGKQPTEQSIALVRHNLGLDKPWYVQYGKFVKATVSGDKYGWPGLGYSYDSNVSIRSKVIEKAPRTLSLILGASIIWLGAGIVIGVISAIKRRTLVDRLAMGFALFGISAPVFWLGLMGLFIFWYKLGWVAGTGYVSPTQSISGWADHLLLPWIVLALLYAAIYARMVRGNLLDAMGEDFIRTARAKGLSESRVIFRHGLRASLAPVVTMFGLDVALLVGGAVITESVFNLDGLGFMAIDAVYRQDLPAVLGVVLLGTFAVVFMNLVVDIVYAFLDPRVRYG
ncbi:MAG: peptide/nickel transport system permease protein [Gaiellaceae bacterium]|jgi:peptide/nickel transport system permease protein|nr:peptide/nickel transport system permease protein [Gaiellaceae bacterium]